MVISNGLTEWLLKSNPWTEYNTRIDLLKQKASSKLVEESKNKMMMHPLIAQLLDELKEWPGHALKRHNDAKHLTHKLAFLANIGIDKDNEIITQVANKIFKQQSEEGAFQITVNIPIRYGGSGIDEDSWMLCDFPTTLYALLKMGWVEDNEIRLAVNYLKELVKENGWPCASSPKFGGKFKGPGKRSDPCPYANLITLKALSQDPKSLNSDECKIGVETILSLWENRKKIKPFLFAMGTDFKKLKAPLIWYDILHVTSVLSEFNWVKKDERLLEMISIIREKADKTNQFTAESVWRAWKDWDFGQKREPSPWITFLATKIINKF